MENIALIDMDTETEEKMEFDRNSGVDYEVDNPEAEGILDFAREAQVEDGEPSAERRLEVLRNLQKIVKDVLKYRYRNPGFRAVATGYLFIDTTLLGAIRCAIAYDAITRDKEFDNPDELAAFGRRLALASPDVIHDLAGTLPDERTVRYLLAEHSDWESPIQREYRDRTITFMARKAAAAGQIDGSLADEQEKAWSWDGEIIKIFLASREFLEQFVQARDEAGRAAEYEQILAPAAAQFVQASRNGWKKPTRTNNNHVLIARAQADYVGKNGRKRPETALRSWSGADEDLWARAGEKLAVDTALAAAARTAVAKAIKERAASRT